MNKKIFVACGTGVCTSTIASDKILKAFKVKRPDVNLEITQGKVTEVEGIAANYDLIVSTAQCPENLKTPVVKGLPFLTGMGMDDAIDEMISKLEV